MNSILKNCPPDILNHIQYRQYPKGEVLTLQEHEEEYVYILLSGSAHVYHLFSDGALFPIATYHAPCFIGDMEALISGNALHMAETAEATHTAVISKKYFLQWIKQDNHLCFTLLLHAQQRLANRGRLLALMQQMPTDSLMWLLIAQSKSGLRKAQLKDRLPASSRTVDRHLCQGVANGWICIKGGEICVLDRPTILSHCKSSCPFLSDEYLDNLYNYGDLFL